MKICTHNGRFHCDQVFACTMLSHYTATFKNAKITRSRDPKVWEASDIVVDVGGKYEPPKLLDHHQIQFQGTYPGESTRLSSAGLVYLHYPEIIPNIIEEILLRQKHTITFDPIVNQQIIAQIRQKIYKKLIIFIDANDNGIDKVHDKEVSFVPTTIWNRIAKLNPMWWEETANEDQLFLSAMEVAREQLYSQVRQILLGSLQTKSIVEIAFNKRKEHHDSGRIVVLEKYVPWQKCIGDIEEEQKCEGLILFMVYPEKGNKKYRIQAVPLKEGSFELRRGLKEEWRGIKDQQKLVNLSGIKDIDFVHANGFIGGACSKESAIKMGELSLQ